MITLQLHRNSENALHFSFVFFEFSVLFFCTLVVCFFTGGWEAAGQCMHWPICFFSFFHFSCLLLLGAGEVVTCLFVCFFFFIELFFILWLNILWFVWVLYCSVCIYEYLFYIYLRLWMLCCWIIWDFECCVVEYLFETLNVVLLYVNVVWLSIYLRL